MRNDDEPLEHIDPTDDGGLELWALALGVNREAVLAAVEAVGTNARAVQAEIGARPEIYKARGI